MIEQKKKQRKMDQFRLLTPKQEFLKISVSLHNAFAVEIHVAQGQWLQEQVNMMMVMMMMMIIIIIIMIIIMRCPCVRRVYKHINNLLI
jgi:hypothetical protein